jgi:competence protein ComEC
MRYWIALLLCLCRPLPAADGKLEIYFVDVEAGNATLVVSPSGESMLIDGGSSGQVNRVIDAVKVAGLKQIDYSLVTHFHQDHYGAVPQLAAKVPIVNWIDHGPAVEAYKSEEWKRAHVLRFSDELYEAYLKARGDKKHIVAVPGAKIPIQGIEVTVLTAGGKEITKPLPGAGAPNKWCDSTPLRAEAENEDSQSVGTLITFGKFRFVFLGDLTWNNGRRLVCPRNLVGPVDVFITTHHAMSVDKENGGEVISGYSACSQAEVWGLAPRVAVLNAGERWHAVAAFNWYGGPKGWETVRKSPGLEDFYQMHYQPQGGAEYNVPEPLIANLPGKPGHWLKLTVSADGSFTMTNTRTGQVKSYLARKN